MKEKNYHKRWLAPIIREAVKGTPVTILTGARQVGKTSLLQQEFSTGWRYLTLDDLDLLEQCKRSPEIVLSSEEPTIFDEAQRAPELFIAIKRIVDQDRSRRFILSGSANLLLMKQVSESLAGRSVFFELAPLTQGELLHHSPPNFLTRCFSADLTFKVKKDNSKSAPLNELVWRGGMPQSLAEKKESVLLQWRDAYTQTYLERDLRQLSQIDNLTDFRRLMIASALRTGQLLNVSEIGRDIGLKQPTAHRYLNLLEVSCLLYRLPPYTVNKGLRLVKSPKLMWVDSGLASHLAGYFSADDLLKSREWGGMLECFVYFHLRELTNLMIPCPRIHYWRTRQGEEVDFVLEQGRHLVAIEVKGTQKVTYRDTIALQTFLSQYPNAKSGIILYAGREVVKFGDKIVALPLSVLW